MSHASPEARLAAAGFALPSAPVPRGMYAPSCMVSGQEGRWIAISGQTCRQDGIAIAGICHGEYDVADARLAAEVAMLNALAALRDACGGQLDRVAQVMRLRGFIRASADFAHHPAVLDAASAVLCVAFPGQLLPARSAVGVASLPSQAWIEIEIDAWALAC